MNKKFKVNENDVTRACDLANKLIAKGLRCWFSINENDISNCKWWIAPIGTSPIDAPMIHGGVGSLHIALRTACYDSGALIRPRHISQRSEMRLSSDANGKHWTAANGG
tara:strand:+ start:147 stop:473 length:327 start_codon:yes stop_codon:yes gene_type:complete